MDMVDFPVAVAGLFVGLIVGLTGMGGGALMTPVLVLLFGVEPLAAVSSDLVASMVMKPIGAAVHYSRKTVHTQLVLWLVLGSVPAAFTGVVLLTGYGSPVAIQQAIKTALGAALLLIATVLVLRPLLARSRKHDRTPGPLVVKPVPTLLIGVVGGFVVGLTSVGSGSLMVMMLLMLYPTMRLSDLVGTDLAQAVPLVASAALAHFMFGDFRLEVTTSILLGSLPGIYLGARWSSRAPDGVIRPVLAVVLTASALKLLGLGNAGVATVVALSTVGSIAHYLLFVQRNTRASAAPEV
jgi:uncharacterized membrane protein YfcA